MKAIERGLLDKLEELANRGIMTTEDFKASDMYQETSTLIGQWSAQVALNSRKYSGLINANTSSPFDEYVDDVIWKSINSIDHVLACSKDGRAKYLMKVASSVIADKGRKYQRENYTNIGEDQELRFVCGDDIYAYIADDTIGVDERLYISEMAEKALSFFPALSLFDATAFTALMVLRVKNSSLTAAIDECELLPVSRWVLKEFDRQCETIINLDFFDDMKFINNDTPFYESRKELSAILSKRALYAAEYLAKRMGIKRKAKTKSKKM